MGADEIARVLREHEPRSAQGDVWCTCNEGPFYDYLSAGPRYSDHLRTHLAPLVEQARQEGAREALAETAEWIANTLGYPVQVAMPDNPPPNALWGALIDVVHKDADGRWHGGELDRDEIDSWLRAEAGFPAARTPGSGTAGGGSDV